MIEQIKQKLELGLIDVDISHKEVYEWLRYLIGEVERLERDAKWWEKSAHGINEANWKKRIQVEELQKALEIVYGIACEEFESVNQMDLIRLTAGEAIERSNNP